MKRIIALFVKCALLCAVARMSFVFTLIILAVIDTMKNHMEK